MNSSCSSYYKFIFCHKNKISYVYMFCLVSMLFVFIILFFLFNSYLFMFCIVRRFLVHFYTYILWNRNKIKFTLFEIISFSFFHVDSITIQVVPFSVETECECLFMLEMSFGSDSFSIFFLFGIHIHVDVLSKYARKIMHEIVWLEENKTEILSK